MKREELSSLRPVSFGGGSKGGRLGNGASAAAWCKIHQLQIKDLSVEIFHRFYMSTTLDFNSNVWGISFQPFPVIPIPVKIVIQILRDYWFYKNNFNE